MDYEAPFFATPDYRENLVLEFRPGLQVSGNVTDETGNGHTGVNTNVPRVATILKDGKALDMDETPANGRIEVTHHADISQLTDFSLSIFFKVRVDGTQVYLSSKTGGWYIRFLSGYKIYVRHTNADVAYMSDGPFVTKGLWQMVTIVQDATNSLFRVYLNEQFGIEIEHTAADLENNLIIGMNELFNTNSDCEIAHVRHYNSVLNHGQIKRIGRYVRRQLMGLNPVP